MLLRLELSSLFVGTLRQGVSNEDGLNPLSNLAPD
jgi:hypothetical protein